MNKSFILHIDTLNVLDELTDEQAGKLFKEIRNFHNGINSDLEFGLRMAFLPFKNQFERDKLKYLSVCERNKNNGSKGGRPKNQEIEENPEEPKEPSGLFGNPEEPKKPDNDNDNDSESDNNNDSENEKEKKRIRKPFKKPTIEEVKKYFFENGCLEIAAEKMFKYYDCANWFDAKGSPILNWKQKAQMVWFKEENKIPNQTQKQTPKKSQAVLEQEEKERIYREKLKKQENE